MSKLVKWEAKEQNLHRLFRENLFEYTPFPKTAEKHRDTFYSTWRKCNTKLSIHCYNTGKQCSIAVPLRH